MDYCWTKTTRAYVLEPNANRSNSLISCVLVQNSSQPLKVTRGVLSVSRQLGKDR